jgi:hypothetical protein
MDCSLTRLRNPNLFEDGAGELFLTPNRVLVTDASGRIVASQITTGELSALDGIRSNIQDQIDAIGGVIDTGDLTESGSSVLSFSGNIGAVVGTGTTIEVLQATASQDGYLSSSDWQTFNSKLDNSLSEGNIFIGDASDQASEVSLSGDVTVSPSGVVSIASGAIENSNVANNAAISFTKMAPLTPQRVAITSPSGSVTVSTLSSSQLPFLSDVTSPVQAQIDSKLTVNLTTPAEGDIIYRNSSGDWVNLPVGTNDQVLKSDGTTILWADENTSTLPAGGDAGEFLRKQSGANFDADWEYVLWDDIANATISLSELSILNGAIIDTNELNNLEGSTSNIQNQINNKQDTLTGSIVSLIGVNLPGSRAVITDPVGQIAVSPTTSNEIAFLQGLSSNAQAQIDARLIYGGTSPSSGDVLYFDGADWVNLAAGTDGQVLKLSSGLPSWGTDIGGGGGGLPAGGTIDQILTKDSSADDDATWKDVVWSMLTDVSPTLTEINYVDGVTSSIQTQIDNKQDTVVGGASTITLANLTASRALISNVSGKVAVSVVTSDELAQLDGISTSQTVQAQLDARLVYGGTAPSTGDIIYYDGLDWVNLGTGSNSQVLTLVSGEPSWQNAPTSGGIALPSGGVINSALRKTNVDINNHTIEWYEPELGDLFNVTPSSESVGDLLYYDGAKWVNLQSGANNQILVSQLDSSLSWEDNSFENLSDTDIQPANLGVSSISYWSGSAWIVTTPPTPGEFLQAQGSSLAWDVVRWSDIDGPIISTVELNRLDGVTGNVQTQLNGKQDTITGAATSITLSNLTSNRAVISNTSGKISVSPTTATEVSYLQGVTSPIQSQLDARIVYSGTNPSSGEILYWNGGWNNLPKGDVGEVLKVTGSSIGWAPDISGGSGSLPAGGGANQYLKKNSSFDFDADWFTLVWDDITDVLPSLAEINFVDGVTSPIQPQINSKQNIITGAASTVTSSLLTPNRVVVSDGAGRITQSSLISTTELNQLDGINTGQTIQTQINGKQNTITVRRRSPAVN